MEVECKLPMNIEREKSIIDEHNRLIAARPQIYSKEYGSWRMDEIRLETELVKLRADDARGIS